MEPALLSGPLGHTQWETEQTFPLGFHSLDSDNGSVLCQNKSGQTGLGIRLRDQDQTLKSVGEEGLFQNNVPDLDSLINIAELAYGDLQYGRDQQTNSQDLSQRTEELSSTDNAESSDEICDSTLSWLFASGLFEVSEKNSTCDQLNQPSEAPNENSHASSSETDSLTVGVPSCTTDISITSDSLLLVDFFSDELLSPCDERITEEGTGLSLSWDVVSPDIGDKGLYPDQVTDLPVTSTSTTQSLPENCLPLEHTSPHRDCIERPVPLLDLEVPLCDNSLCPASPVSPLSPLLLLTEPEQTGFTVTSNQGDVLALELLVETSPEESVQSDTRLADTKKNEEMTEELRSEAKIQDSSTALDLCPATDDVHNGEHWNLQNGTLGTEAMPNKDPDHLEGADILDFSVRDPSAEAEWTNKQTVETLCLSKMVGDDSVPMVPTVSTSEEDVSPLKAVFDALDQDGDGFVRIEEFMEFAAAYGADQVKDLTKFLDPSGLGVISFEDFHRGISAISNGGLEPQLYGVNYSPGDGAVGCPEEYDEQNEVTDSAYLGSESTYSECETFTDEDTGACVAPEMHEEVETDSGIEATLHDPEDRSNRFSLNSELHNHSSSLVTVIGGEEEHFEDFGESNTSELLLETSADQSQGDGPALTTTPQQLNGSSLLSPSAGKRLSSKKVARHLLQNSSMTLDTVSDLTRDILELADNDITDKVLLLERRVAELEKESEASGEQHARLRQENLQLVHRANALEEQLKEQELCTDELLQQEARRHKDAISKLERERGLELENLHARLQQLDEENSELRSCVPCLRANIERLEEEKKKLQDETEALSDRLQDETENRSKLANKLSHERHINQKEKESTQELIEDLRKQLEHLQLYKLEIETKRGRSPGAGLQEYQTRTREAELEQEIKRLKQDNRSLKEQNDELNGQIINLSIQGAKNLMSASFSDSLAAEISSVSRAELMETVHKQEEINYRLQDYIDKIIVAIMESNPSILEVK